jgi:hypothetical protein
MTGDIEKYWKTTVLRIFYKANKRELLEIRGEPPDPRYPFNPHHSHGKVLSPKTQDEQPFDSSSLIPQPSHQHSTMNDSQPPSKSQPNPTDQTSPKPQPPDGKDPSKPPRRWTEGVPFKLRHLLLGQVLQDMQGTLTTPHA